MYHYKYLLAIDLGTTRIRASLSEAKTGKRILACAGNNPQAIYGFDILTRIARAAQSAEQAGIMSKIVRDAIRRAIDLLEKHHEMKTIEIGRVMITGNTAMLALLAEKNYANLLIPEFWDKRIDCSPSGTDTWKKEWGLCPEAGIQLAPTLSGFVGSDLIADVLATGLNKGNSCSLLIDFGTNSEIALWDGHKLWVTAAAGGPAFEICSVEIGMPAIDGALFRFKQDDPDETAHYEVIGNVDPKGICGSGMVDIIACMIRQKKLNPNGNFAKDILGNKILLLHEGSGIYLHKQDVDAFQRAKAAVVAGIVILLQKANKGFEDIRRLCVCGAFGQFLNYEHAMKIGLLPPVSTCSIETWG